MALYACLSLLAVFIGVFYLFCKNRYSYWSNKGVDGPYPLPVVGNFGKVILQIESANQCLQDIYFKYPNHKLVGIYRGFQPVILVRDPALIKHVLVKDFHVFQDRGVSTSNSRLSSNLFAAEGETWRIMRQKLTPLFTSRKLKDMIPVMQQVVDRFMKYVDYIVENNVDHEIRSLTGKYTLEVIGSCAFGLDLNTFTEENNQFSIMAKKVFEPNTFVRFTVILDMIIPGIRKMFTTGSDIQNFFVELVRKVVKEREGKPSERKDFMDLMIELREQGKVSRNLEDGVSEIVIDDYLIAAQALVFYSAGFDTSSATMSFLFHELALNPDIQDRVYKDICVAMDKHNGKINYETIKDMKYLEMAFDETLRKYSVASILLRKTLVNYTFPGTNVTITKGTPVMVSASALNKDPEYFPNPQKFNPENFSPDNIKNVPPCVYMPFGEGPRNCIGMRFAKVQSMIGSAAFLKKFKVEPSSKTEREFEFNPKAIILTAKKGIWVKISKR